MTTVHLDFETRSAAPFGKSAGKHSVSAYQYSIHPSTEVLWASYAFGDEPVKQWRAYRGDPFPDDLAQAVADGVTIAAHNAGFECLIWNNVLAPEHGLAELPIEQMDCTAARAAIMSLPRDLDGVTKAMGMAHVKDEVGHKLMMKMSKPRRPRKNEDQDAILWHESDEDMERLGLYCDRDVEAERGLDKVLAPMSKFQRAQWLRVHHTNMRGVLVDVDFVQKAKRVDDVVQARYTDRLKELTDGNVTSATAIPAMKKWLESQDVIVDSLDKGGVIHLLEEHRDNATVGEVLRIRQEAGKSSVAKLDRFEILSDHNCRMLENFLFHAANTGRLGGRGAQLQNLPSRGGLPYYWAETCIQIISESTDPAWAAEKIEMLYGEIPTALSSCLRGVIKAREGSKLFVADFSNIEGRVAAWLGDEKWKLLAFGAYDRGEGPDLYKVTAGQILGKSPDQVDKVERNVMGKVPELACFAADTQVLTDRGYLGIVEVKLTDKLWDGREWINHSGVVEKGVQQTINLDGVEVTANHKILCGRSWRAAKKLASSENILTLALATGSENLPSLAAPKRWAKETERPSCSAVAGPTHTECTYQACLKGRALDATRALRRPQPLTGKCTTATPNTWLTMNTADGCSIDCPQPKDDVITHATQCTHHTAAEAYGSASYGRKTEGRSSDTYRHYPGGINRILRWTGLTLTEITRRATYVLSPNGLIRAIKGVSTTSNDASVSLRKVYDIAFAGARNRFTIRSSSGHLIVHNCGFGGGVGAFDSMARIYQVDMSQYWEGIRTSMDDQFIEKARWGWGKYGAAQADGMEMSQESWLASETVKNAWRDRHPGIVACWAKCEELSIRALQYPGKWLPWADGKCAIGAREFGGKMFLMYRLPSGRILYQADASLKSVTKFGRKAQEIRFFGVNSVTRQWCRQSTYGGSQFQGVVQAIAYDLMDHGWKNVEEKGFDVVLSVHDEVGAEGDADRDLAEFEAAMNDTPDWAEGCPVSSEGYVSDRYRKDG